MKKISVLFFLSLAGLFLIRCTPVTFPAGDQLVVSWKVISNEYADQPAVKTQFTIENKSNFRLNASNWSLFYSQMPREVISCSGNTSLTRISGDWFKLVPAEGFELKPGDKTEIITELSEWLIKETDAPMGLYFVFYDKSGAEQAVVPVTAYTIEPFALPEQINRYRNDPEPIPTAGWRYQQNLKMKELDRNQLPLVIPTPVSVKTNGNSVVFDAAPEVLYQKGLEFEAGYIAAFLQKVAESSFVPQEARNPKPARFLSGSVL